MQRSLISGFAVFLGLTVSTAQAAPNVVASIKPVHSLVASVMAGIGTPHLVLDGGASPHGFSLKPSDAAALSQAEVVFWIGSEMERFLIKPLGTLADKAKSIPLMDAENIALLPYRSGGIWDAHDHGAEAGEMKGHNHDHAHDATEPDPHIWLDPANAQAMIAKIAATLAELDPDNAPVYLANAEKSKSALRELEADLDRMLAPVRDIPFVVFHDAFQYLEHRYWLTGGGAITINPEIAPGAARLAEIHDHIQDSGAVCVFSEPQFEPRVIQVVIEGTGARTGLIDPLGADLTSGPALYGQLMLRNAATIRACLAPN